MYSRHCILKYLPYRYISAVNIQQEKLITNQVTIIHVFLFENSCHYLTRKIESIGSVESRYIHVISKDNGFLTSTRVLRGQQKRCVRGQNEEFSYKWDCVAIDQLWQEYKGGTVGVVIGGEATGEVGCSGIGLGRLHSPHGSWGWQWTFTKMPPQIYQSREQSVKYRAAVYLFHLSCQFFLTNLLCNSEHLLQRIALNQKSNSVQIWQEESMMWELNDRRRNSESSNTFEISLYLQYLEKVNSESKILPCYTN